MTQEIESLLTVEDVMALLRISRPTLYRMLKADQLPTVRIGKRTLFDPADIRAFIEQSKGVTRASSKGTKEQEKPQQKQGTAKRKEVKKKDAVKQKEPKERKEPKKVKVPKKKPVEQEQLPPPDEKDDSDKQGRLL